MQRKVESYGNKSDIQNSGGRNSCDDTQSGVKAQRARGACLSDQSGRVDFGIDLDRPLYL